MSIFDIGYFYNKNVENKGNKIMIKVINKRAERTPVIPPPYAYNAEITIEEDGKILYVHICSYAETSYTVAEKSSYDYMTRNFYDNDMWIEESGCGYPIDEEAYEKFDFLEEYIDYDDAMESKYAEYFKMAEDMIEKL